MKHENKTEKPKTDVKAQPAKSAPAKPQAPATKPGQPHVKAEPKKDPARPIR